MSDRMYVATRKGLFVVDRGPNGSWQLSSTSFLGDPVTMLLDDPGSNRLYAALNLGHFGVKMHRSDDRGASWTECQAPAFPERPAGPGDGEERSGPSVKQVWSLAVGEANELWAGTIPGALFRSTDGADNWTLVRSLWDRPERANWFGGGYDDPGIHSICVHPRDARHIIVGISCGGVWETRDRGETWDCRTDGMYAEYMPPERREDPTIQDPHRVVQCPADPNVMWAQHHNGVFRTVDGAASWTDVTAVRPTKFGFAVAVHPGQPDTAWLVPAVKDECRIPQDGRVVVARTRDGGKSFDVLREGLPQQHAYDLVFRHALDVDSTGERLAMGSTTGSLWVTENGGDRWTAIHHHLPPIYQVAFAAR